MKDVYGLENGSEESLVDIDKLIKKMKKNGYEVVERENFNDIAKQELKKYQREILSYHELLVLQKSV
jgi:biotin operon repressor